MKKTILFLSLATIISASTAFAATTTTKPAPAPAAPAATVAATLVPCATMATQVDTAIKSTKIKGAKLVAAEKHNKAGIALCKAQKVKNADVQFSAALKLLGV